MRLHETQRGGGTTVLFLPPSLRTGGIMTNKSIPMMLAIATLVITLSIAVCTVSSTESDAATSVSDSDSLINAINSAGTEEVEITLDSNITTSESIEIDGGKHVDINLNRHTLTFSGNTDSTLKAYITIKQAKVTFSGTGTVTSDGVTINMFGSDKAKQEYSVLSVGENVTISGETAILIDNGEINNCGVKVNISGTLLTTDDSETIVISETSTRTIGVVVPTITVESTGTIDGKNGTGVHSAGFGLWYIDGTVKGNVAAQLDSGRIYVRDGASILGGDSFTAPDTSGDSASSAAGIGILLAQNASYVLAEINYGTISGAYAIYEIDLDDNHNGITLKIVNGTFKGDVYSGSKTGFITGGTFDTDVSEYVDTSYRLDESPDGSGYIVSPISNGAIRIGSTYYTTLADAVERYKTGDIIELLDDISTEPLSIMRGVEINLNGHTLTIAGGTQMTGINFANGQSSISNGHIIDGRSTDGSGGYTALTVSTGSLTVTDVSLSI